MKTKRRVLIVGITLGSLLTLAPVFGMLGTVVSMMQAFSALGSSGISDPRALSESIGTALFSTAAGLFIFPLGIVVLTLSLVFFFRLRASAPSRQRQQPAPETENP